MSVAIGACHFEHGMLSDVAVIVDDAAIPDVAVPVDARAEEITVTIATNNDDALQDPPPGAMLVAYSWVSLYTEDHWGALRFVVPQIMHGATIVDAYLDVYVDTGATEDDPNVAITSEASANPAALAVMNNNISNRPRGSAIVVWQADNIGSGLRRSPSIANIVQERVDDAAWAPGQAILFILDALGPSLEIRQHDYAPAGTYAPTLVVRYINP
jgi:hypothetical protein